MAYLELYDQKSETPQQSYSRPPTRHRPDIEVAIEKQKLEKQNNKINF